MRFLCRIDPGKMRGWKPSELFEVFPDPDVEVKIDEYTILWEFAPITMHYHFVGDIQIEHETRPQRDTRSKQNALGELTVPNMSDAFQRITVSEESMNASVYQDDTFRERLAMSSTGCFDTEKSAQRPPFFSQ